VADRVDKVDKAVEVRDAVVRVDKVAAVVVFRV
jgi:hypothetical protein